RACIHRFFGVWCRVWQWWNMTPPAGRSMISALDISTRSSMSS
ncbi:uncharacterized protein METZ01_LOCUS485702, partial [marine metagenome]